MNAAEFAAFGAMFVIARVIFVAGIADRQTEVIELSHAFFFTATRTIHSRVFTGAVGATPFSGYFAFFNISFFFAIKATSEHCAPPGFFEGT